MKKMFILMTILLFGEVGTINILGGGMLVAIQVKKILTVWDKKERKKHWRQS